MGEATITLKGKALKKFSALKSKFGELGFSSASVTKGKLVLEKAGSEDLRGALQDVYRVTFYPDKIVFIYPLGADRLKSTFEAFKLLLNLIRISEDFYQVGAGELRTPFTQLLSDARELMESENYATARQLQELRERHATLEKKYKELILSSEQNARILLECEKKRNEYQSRVSQLEGMSGDTLVSELFKWLRTHNGEINVQQFSKLYSISPSRVEEGLDYLLRKSYIKRR